MAHTFLNLQGIRCDHCRTMDLHLDGNCQQLVPRLQMVSALLPSFDAVFVDSLTCNGVPNWLPVVKRVILSAFHICETPSNDYSTGGWRTVEKLVFNYTASDGDQSLGCQSPARTLSTTTASQLRKVVVVFHGVSACSHCLMMLLEKALGMAIPITLVCPDNLNWLRAIKRYIVEGLSFVDLNSGYKHIGQGVQVASGEEYRKALGDKEY